MILLDPDLDPDPAPSTAKPSAVSSVKKSNAATQDKDLRTPATRTLARFLTAAQTAVRLKGQVNVLLTTDTAIRRLNRQFRGKNKATDVLSFPSSPAPRIKSAEAPLAGDLAISVPTARKQAIAQGHSLATEIKVLMLHGLLHLAGYDHETDSGQMARREGKLRAGLKLPLGLIERAIGHPEKKPRIKVNPAAGGRKP
jgi:probable rRNA maturation factor